MTKQHSRLCRGRSLSSNPDRERFLVPLLHAELVAVRILHDNQLLLCTNDGGAEMAHAAHFVSEPPGGTGSR